MVNQTLLERARCMLSNASQWHQHDLWVVAISMSFCLVNRSPHSVIDFNIHEEIWSENCVDYSFLCILGWPAFVHVDDGKLAPRPIKCIFLIYSSELKGYHLLSADGQSCKVTLGQDVTFNEKTMSSSSSSSMNKDRDDQAKVGEKVELEMKSIPYVGVHMSSDSLVDELHSIATPHISAKQDNYLIAKDRPRRQIKRSSKYTKEFVTARALSTAQEIDNNGEPTNYIEDISYVKSSKWSLATEKEFQSLHKKWHLGSCWVSKR